MFYYARSDTHYLLYIYDMIRNELNERSDKNNPEENYMEHVLERSKETSLRRHEKFVYDAETGRGPLGWFNPLMKQSSGNFSREQFAVFRAVHKWRDDVARREDESPAFIMGNAAIFDIARRLPPDPKALHSMISQSSYVAKQSVSELFKIVDKAKIDGANGPTVSEFFRDTGTGSSSNTQGIGAVAQQVFPQLKKLSSIPIRDTKELTAEASRLWGQVPISSRWEAASGTNGVSKTMQFTLPWAGFVENASVIEPLLVEQQPAVQPQVQIKGQAAEPEHDEEFTLKAGIKRKAPEPDSEEESEDEGDVEMSNSDPNSSALLDDEISVNSSTDEDAKTKAQRKAEKKARKERKRAKKQAQNEASGAADAGSDQEVEDEEPFDYTKAKSVLKAERNAAIVADSSGKGGKAKIFNPYAAKAAEGPKPARRMHGEKPGKSATFRSANK
jgi:exosome complex exonuclease RRP6